jgi:aminoglycoside 3-N-acetyltransferase
MQSVTQAQVAALLRALGLRPGDNLLVHAAIQFLGKPEGGVGAYFAAICEVAGSESGISDAPPTTYLATPIPSPAPRTSHPAALTFTIAVPAFNFAFARGEPYDPASTPSQGMGAFAEYVRRLPGARRTPHPMQSLAAIGPYAEDLAGRDTPSAFDPGSAFERLLALDFKLLYLGANIDATSLLHYSEQRFQVPYRYWKTFSGPVRTVNGWERRTYRMYVRDLEANPVLTLAPAQALLERRGQWHSLPLNYGRVSLCRAVDFTAAVDDLLSADPWCLVTNPCSI